MRKIIIASLSLALYGCIEVEATNKVDGYECARKAKELKVEYHYGLLCGKPVILIDNGKIIQENLRATRVTLDELTSHLRQHDVLDLGAVQYAILETDGNLSVFPYAKERPAAARDAGLRVREQRLPFTIIEDGYFSRENLIKAHKDQKWLDGILEEKNADVASTFLLTVDDKGHVYWLGKDGV